MQKIQKLILFRHCVLVNVNPQKRLILSLRVQMRVLLEFGQNLGIFAYCYLSSLRVLLECGSYLRAGLFRGFSVCKKFFNKVGRSSIDRFLTIEKIIDRFLTEE